MKRVLVLGLLPLLAACGGRFPAPDEVKAPGDFDLTCTMLETEMEGNRDKVAYLLQRQDDTTTENLAVGTMAFATAMPPLFLALDISDANFIEMEALRERTRHLEDIHTAKGCHIHTMMPAGFSRYTRQHQGVEDRYGRRLELPVNHYVYSPPADGQDVARAADKDRF